MQKKKKKSSGRLGFFLNYKPEFEDVFQEDLDLFSGNIREYTILGLEDLFVQNNLHLCCDQENTFSIYELNKKEVENKVSSLKEMTATEENKEKLRKILKDFGFIETNESF